MAATHLAKITSLAKRIRKANPSKKWSDCVKMASKQLKGSNASPKKAAKKVAGFTKGRTRFVEVGEKAPKKGKAVRVIRRTRSGKRGTFKDFVSIGSVTKAGTKMLEDKLGKISVAHALSTKKRDKAALAKQKSQIIRNIKKLQTIK